MVEPPIWKICSSNWIISPGRDENKKCWRTIFHSEFLEFQKLLVGSCHLGPVFAIFGSRVSPVTFHRIQHVQPRSLCRDSHIKVIGHMKASFHGNLRGLFPPNAPPAGNSRPYDQGLRSPLKFRLRWPSCPGVPWNHDHSTGLRHPKKHQKSYKSLTWQPCSVPGTKKLNSFLGPHLKKNTI